MTSFFPLTEDQIEVAVSRKIDRLDAAFMSGKFDQSEYDRRMQEIYDWADVEYRFRRRN